MHHNKIHFVFDVYLWLDPKGWIQINIFRAHPICQGCKKFHSLAIAVNPPRKICMNVFIELGEKGGVYGMVQHLYSLATWLTFTAGDIKNKNE